jgi:hypothetical protein
MKKAYMVLAIAMMMASFAVAQQQTLISGALVSGGFGGPTVKFTQVNDELGVLVGGHGAWLINHSITLGGGGYGLTNRVIVKEINADTAQYLGMGYGGVEIGCILYPDKLLHLSANTLIGSGTVQLQNRARNNLFEVQNNQQLLNNGNFFVLEPNLSGELNITAWMRCGFSASYRYINGVDDENITDAELSGPSASVNFMFGRF